MQPPNVDIEIILYKEYYHWSFGEEKKKILFLLSTQWRITGLFVKALWRLK